MIDDRNPASRSPVGAAGRLLLLGLPGAGKTTLGRQLAAHYGWPFVDLDQEVEARAGQTIASLFAAQGEAYFRELEAQVLRAVLGQPGPLVLATGGGTPCFHDNLTALQAGGLTVWLDVPLPVLAARLRAGGLSQRPLLAAAGALESWLGETLSRRREFYSQARYHARGAAATDLPALLAGLDDPNAALAEAGDAGSGPRT